MLTDPADQAWAADPLPVLPSTPLRVDWPVGGLDPFDVADRRTQRMMFASGFARAFPATDGAQPACDARTPLDVIPVGYSTLSLLEKLAVVHAGRLIAEWPRSHAPTGTGSATDQAGAPRPMHLRVHFQTSTHMWAARDRRWIEAARRGESPAPRPNMRLTVAGCRDYADTLDLALALSAIAGEEPLMVVDVLESWMWH